MTGVVRDGMLSLKGIMLFNSAFRRRAQAIRGSASVYSAICRNAFAVLLVVACGLPVQWASGADPKQVYQESSDALYNLDFSTAQHGYEALTRDYPDNPDYWNALASSIWLKITYDQQKLNIESFSGKATFGTKESKEGVSPEDEKRLRDTVATAMAKAQAILDKNPNDVHGLYAMGIANATMASFEST